MTKRFLLATTALAFVSISAAPALAQDAKAPADVAPGDIIITATKREQALQDVPIAVSAISGDQLKAAGVTDVRALQTLSPSLVLTSSASEAAGTVARIRGIGTTGDNPGLESAVAIFIDGVYRNRNNVGLTELGEVERIELLRGPQGTLFGRNASAGLINVVTKGPQSTFGGYAEATYGNYDQMRFAAGVTGPLGDSVAARIDGVYGKRDGFMDDLVTGQDYNDRNRWMLRGQLKFTPSDDINIRFIADYSDRKEQCCAAATIVRGPTAAFIEGLGGSLGSGGAAGTVTYDRLSATTPGFSFQTDVKEWGVSAEVNWDFNAVKLTSISAYRDWQASRGQDADFSSASIFQRPDGGQVQEFKTLSQELRLNGTAFDDKLDWLVGGYYANEKLALDDTLRYGSQYDNFASCLIFNGVLPAAARPFISPSSPGCISSAGVTALRTNPALAAFFANPARPGVGSLAAVLGQPANSLDNTGLTDQHRQKSTNIAVFTHNVFNLTDKFSVTIGARYTEEKKTYDGINLSNNTLCRAIATASGALAGLRALAGAPCAINNLLDGIYSSDRKESEWSGTAVLSYKVNDDLLTYASYSKGYKGGGYNLDRSGLALDATLAGAGTLGFYPLLSSTNPGVTRDTLQFDPEKVDAYELGVKYGTRAFTVNVAAYLQDFSDFQLNTFNGVNFIVANLPKVKSKGVEVEAFARPTDHLTLGAGMSYSIAKYGNNLVTPTTLTTYATPTATNTAGGALFRLPGQQITNAPKYTFSGNMGYRRPITESGIEAFINADFRYQSDVNSGSDLDAEKIQDGYTIVNGRIGIGDADSKWSLEFFAKNIFDKNYFQVGFDAPLQGSGNRQALVNTQTFNAFLGDPRTFGITLRSKF
jgi:iron complex outermembrane recepter protein